MSLHYLVTGTYLGKPWLLPLSEQVDRSQWCQHNSIGHNITFYYWSVVLYRYEVINVKNGVPLKSGLRVIENTTFGYSMYDFLL